MPNTSFIQLKSGLLQIILYLIRLISINQILMYFLYFLDYPNYFDLVEYIDLFIFYSDFFVVFV